MSFFSHICSCCDTNIRFDGVDGEVVVLRHIRHGEVVGEAVGEYDGYGRVRGSDYRSLNTKGINSHLEIWKSENGLEDSGTKSGTSAYHFACYQALTPEEKAKNVISKYDPKDGYGQVRAKFKIRY